MSIDPTKSHKDVVKSWKEKNVQGLRCEQLLRIYSSAILAVQQRCLETLSTVTVQVVFDRVLHEGLDKFPLLSHIKIEAHGLELSDLDHNIENYNQTEVSEALGYLLEEFLTVVGNITSEVLTAPLHKELMNVTRENALSVLVVQNLRPTPKKRGGK